MFIRVLSFSRIFFVFFSNAKPVKMHRNAQISKPNSKTFLGRCFQTTTIEELRRLMADSTNPHSPSQFLTLDLKCQLTSLLQDVWVVYDGTGLLNKSSLPFSLPSHQRRYIPTSNVNPALVLRDCLCRSDLVLKDLVLVLVFTFVTRYVSLFQRRAIQRRLRLESEIQATFQTFCPV